MNKNDQGFSAQKDPAVLNGGTVLDLHSPSGARYSAYPQITEIKIAERAGSAPAEINVRMPGGKSFNLLGTKSIGEIEASFQACRRTDPFATNIFFKPGMAAPLFPLANRLVGQEIGGDLMQAKILGQTVRVPVNHGREPGARPHHLHGLAFDKTPSTFSMDAHGTEATYRAHFAAGFYGNLWTGSTDLTITETLRDSGFEFRMDVKNTGSTPVPVGAGAHPYFRAPSGNPKAVRLNIPGKSLVEIDNYTNVLPTGRIEAVRAGGEFDFNRPGGVALNGRYLDNLWVDLLVDKDGLAYAEFSDTEAKLRVRLTALTRNIIGIQAYAPRPETDPSLGVFAALELVTNLPDPREELWGKTPTGMVLLEPGQSFSYGYKIEVYETVTEGSLADV